MVGTTWCPDPAGAGTRGKAMSDFQKEVRTTMRSTAEIEAERNHNRRSAGIGAFIDATNAP
jgi:hypothetical protein